MSWIVENGTLVGGAMLAGLAVVAFLRLARRGRLARRQRDASEKSLRESEVRYNTLADSIPQLAWAAHADGHIFWYNRRWYEYTGKTPEEMEGWGWQSAHDPEELPKVLQRWKGSIATGEPFDMVFPLKGKDGVFRSFLTRVEPVKDDGGRVVRWFGTSTDLTEQKRAEEAVREGEERFRATFDQAAVGIAHVGLDGRWLRVNRKLCDTVGYGPDEMTGMTFQDITHPDDLEADLAHVRRLLAGEIETYSMEKRYFRKDRSLIWINLTASLVRTPQGAPKYFISVVEDITDEKRVRDALRESEGKYRTLFENMAEEVHFWRVIRDDRGRVLTWRLVDANPPALRTWDKTLARIEGRTPDEIFGPGSTDHFLPVVRKIMAEGVPHSFEDYFPNLDKHFRFTSVPLGDHFVTTGADITALKKAHESMRSSEARLRLFIENAPAAIAMFDRDMRYLAVSRRWLTDYGLGGREVVGLSHYEVFHDLPESWRAVHRRGLAGEVSKADEDRFDRADGRTQWLRWEVRPWYEIGGEVGGIVIFTEDITARRTAEEQFRLLADSIPQLAWAAHADGHIFWYNRRWYEYTGKTPEEMEGWGWQSAHDPQELPKVLQRWRGSIASGEPFDMVFPLRGADGRFCPFLTRVVPLKDARGRVLQWFGTNTDITEQRQLQEALLEADRRKDEFLATLAHELRNPLAPIRTGLQVMRVAGADGPAAEEVQRMMERQITQMVRLVDDLLDISRITRDKIELRKERVELASLVASAVETSRPLLEGAGHDFTVTVPPEPVWLEVDATRMTQVLANLLDNAAKYTPRGGNVRLLAEKTADGVEITVEDDGVGIPEAMRSRVFDLFTQVGRPLERSQGGLGIGLTLVKRLVEMHGGTVEATSAGRGSAFVVRLPTAAAPERPAAGSRLEAGRPRTQRRILVVDDNEDSADSLSLLLGVMDNEVRTAYDGLAGVEEAEAFRPDVILLDIGMPRLNGFDACRRIRELPWGKSAFIIAQTGWGQEEDRRRSREAGFDKHLVKPIDPAALVRLLDSGREEPTPR